MKTKEVKKLNGVDDLRKFARKGGAVDSGRRDDIGGSRSHEEDELEKACVEWFRWQYASNPMLQRLLIHVPNEGRLAGGRREGGLRKAMGVVAGVADLLLLVGKDEQSAMSGNNAISGWGGYLGIELKTERGRQSESQQAWEEAVIGIGGGDYVIVRSLEDFQEVVKRWLGK